MNNFNLILFDAAVAALAILYLIFKIAEKVVLRKVRKACKEERKG